MLERPIEMLLICGIVIGMLHTFIRNTEKVRLGAIHYARHIKAQYVICGHTHHVEDAIIDDVRYLNPGSWTDSPAHFIGITQERIEIAEYT